MARTREDKLKDFKSMMKFRRILNQNPEINKFQEWLKKYIFPTEVNISDFIHRKQELGRAITSNDISIVKYSGGLQFLITALLETEQDNEVIINRIIYIINKLQSRNILDKFIEENKDLIKGETNE